MSTSMASSGRGAAVQPVCVIVVILTVKLRSVLLSIAIRVRRRSSEPASAVKTVPHLKAAASMRALFVTMATCGTAQAVSSACVNGVRCCANGSSAPDQSAHGEKNWSICLESAAQSVRRQPVPVHIHSQTKRGRKPSRVLDVSLI